MQHFQANRVYSASDLVHFVACRHHTYLDLVDLETPLPTSEDNPEAELLRDKGVELERTYLASLKSSGCSIVEIPTSGTLAARAEATQTAMAAGTAIIYQALLLWGAWHGYADFLRRVEIPSGLGKFSYEVLDTKLARSPAVKHVIQLCAYCDLLTGVQGLRPHSMHLVLGDRREVSFRVADFSHYYARIKSGFESFCQSRPAGSYPQPCLYCDLCRWRHLCTERWQQDDHLSLVANIQRRQIQRLQEAGLTTVRQLSEVTDLRIPRIGENALARLQAQARLQARKRDTGCDQLEKLQTEPGRGFARMPRPHPGDLFFDMEGDPFYPDGLEYLFGVYGVGVDHEPFRPIWGHDHDQERYGFESLMDLFAERLAAYPEAHIYHYNHYEPTALKRLASRYATREALLDDLLRKQKFVDLFKVVREGIRVSEPSYSLKNIEAFYMTKRTGDVTTAGQSIVVYERWRTSGEEKLLQEIAAYNRADCESTKHLRDWLVTLRPQDLPWRNDGVPAEPTQPSERILEAEAQRCTYERRLIESATEDERPLRELVAQLLEFHRREAKSEWWAMFDRQDWELDELIEDAECLGGLEAERIRPPVRDKQSLIFTYRFPSQDFKFSVGDSCLVAQTLERAGEIVELDADGCLVRIKRGAKYGLLQESLSIIPSGPIDTKVLRDAIYRFADAVVADRHGYRAVRDLLQRVRPRLRGRAEGDPIGSDRVDPVEATIEAVSRLQDSYLFIQGPPGAGKTFTTCHAIVEMIRTGRKVGVASNSHKAINHLLRAVERHASDRGVRFRGTKKCTAGKPDTFLHGTLIQDVTDNNAVDLSSDLFAGTAWLFARPEFDQALDYLFVDEAGQVSLANVVAMGLSARNLVLVGDQMQLGQPIQGVHPGESAQSILEFLLGDQATISPDRGIFLPTTWRMHADVCGFISEAVYDGRLRPESANQNQRLILSSTAHPALAPTGIRFIPVVHSGCSQKSEAEGRLIRDMFLSLLEQRCCDREGREHPMSKENILVVTPYNVQVNYLKSILPEGARVGTVDKFQGQEAEVVLISMVTSSGEELPRNIEFLYSRNRLNVGISRSRCLAVILASPRLLEVQCQTVEQLKLVNTLCWAYEYANTQPGPGGRVKS